MSHVFLSYCRDDTDLMRRLRDDLCAAGLAVWTDENLIPGTPSWQTAIEYAIEHATCAVALLTPNAKRADWVKNEIAYARSQDVTVYPVLAEGDETTAIPIALINYQWIDLRASTHYDRALADLVTSIRQHDRFDPPTPDRSEETRLSTEEEFAIRRKTHITQGGGPHALRVQIITTPLPPRHGAPVHHFVTVENTGISDITHLEGTYEIAAFPEGARELGGCIAGGVILQDRTLHPGESTLGEAVRTAEDQDTSYIIRVRVSGTLGGHLAHVSATGETVILNVEPGELCHHVH